MTKKKVELKDLKLNWLQAQILYKGFVKSRDEAKDEEARQTYQELMTWLEEGEFKNRFDNKVKLPEVSIEKSKKAFEEMKNKPYVYKNKTN